MDLRRIAEHISRGIVLKRRLPRHYSSLPIYVSPEASLRYWLPMSKADPMLYRMAEELVSPGDVVWDVGANVGLFSMCAAARRAASVLAIEPDPWLCGLIIRSGKAARVPITTLSAAVSDECGMAELEISGRSRAANHLKEATGSTQSSEARFTQAVQVFTLDSLLDRYQAPSVLKIDAETHEVKVLFGAKRIIESLRPKIWCEVSPENGFAVFDFLRRHDYELFAAATPQPRTPLTRFASWDTLAIPKSV
jgi:FkbM family methyltransferase